jgi:hypothetical protein
MFFIKSFPASTMFALSLLFIVSFLSSTRSFAQGKLAKKISITIQQKTLAQTLREIEEKGGFSFSYNSSIINEDSLITLSREDTPVRMILDNLLGEHYDYLESGRYVILLLKAPPAPVKSFTVSGYVIDEGTREKISNASVYESQQLVSALTDTNGYFRLRLHDRYTHVSVIINKQMYRDTIVILRSGVDQQLNLTITRAKIAELTPFVVTKRVEKTWLGRFFLSSRQIIQSMNLMSFLASRPVQLSLTPLLGTHGEMGGQIVNKLSLNIIGGYTAGVNGLELAGAFNIDKKEVKYFQAASIFNVVGGAVRGIQLAGIHNDDLDSLTGLQASGVSNIVKGALYGIQLGGMLNYVRGEVHGVQAAGVINYASHVHGVQIGLINIADTSSGYMIGLFNFVKKGLHQLTLSADEVFPVNLAYKVGNHKAYSILQASYNPVVNQRAYAIGFGIGYVAKLHQRWAIVSEFTLRNLYLGHWEDMPHIERLQSSLQLGLGRRCSLYTGPAISFCHLRENKAASGYRSDLSASGYARFGSGLHDAGWLGWSMGINFF